MIDMKNRATAAKLPPIDDDMAENTAVRLAGSSTTSSPPEVDADFQSRVACVWPSGRRAARASRPNLPLKIFEPSKKGAATRCSPATSGTWPLIR